MLVSHDHTVLPHVDDVICVEGGRVMARSARHGAATGPAPGIGIGIGRT